MAALFVALFGLIWILLWVAAAWFLFAQVIPGRARLRDSREFMRPSTTPLIYWYVVATCLIVLVIAGSPIVVVAGVATGILPRGLLGVR